MQNVKQYQSPFRLYKLARVWILVVRFKTNKYKNTNIQRMAKKKLPPGFN